MREAVRDARYDARHVVRDVIRDVMREVQAATGWTWSDGRDYERAERRREQADRRRDDAERRRERLEARRDERARQRDARAYRTVSPTDDPCTESRDGDRGHACEVRDSRLPAPVGPLTVDAAPNGGIRVEGWDQPDVLVRAVVQTHGDDDAEARALLPQRAGDGRRHPRGAPKGPNARKAAPQRLVGELPHLGAAADRPGAHRAQRRRRRCTACAATRASPPPTAA